MSNEDIDRLKTLEPVGVDTDAILFAAGKASARPNRFWQFACAGLLLSNGALAIWTFAPSVEVQGVHRPEATPIIVDESIPIVAEPSSYLALGKNPDGLGPWPESIPATQSPPLRAMSRDWP